MLSVIVGPFVSLIRLNEFDYLTVLIYFKILNMRTKILCQITTRRINFIVDNTECNGDGLDCSSEIRDQEKDRSWLMSSLHQIFSRR